MHTRTHIADHRVSSDQLPLDSGEPRVGSRVLKLFPGFGEFWGRITDIRCPGGGKKWYRVDYDDGDSEEYNFREIEVSSSTDPPGRSPVTVAHRHHVACQKMVQYAQSRASEAAPATSPSHQSHGSSVVRSQVKRKSTPAVGLDDVSSDLPERPVSGLEVTRPQITALPGNLLTPGVSFIGEADQSREET